MPAAPLRRPLGPARPGLASQRAGPGRRHRDNRVLAAICCPGAAPVANPQRPAPLAGAVWLGLRVGGAGQPRSADRGERPGAGMTLGRVHGPRRSSSPSISARHPSATALVAVRLEMPSSRPAGCHPGTALPGPASRTVRSQAYKSVPGRPRGLPDLGSDVGRRPYDPPDRSGMTRAFGRFDQPQDRSPPPRRGR